MIHGSKKTLDYEPNTLFPAIATMKSFTIMILIAVGLYTFYDDHISVCMDLGSEKGVFERSKHDTYQKFLLVDTKHPFPCDGKVKKVMLWAGSDSNRTWTDDRELKVYL